MHITKANCNKGFNGNPGNLTRAGVGVGWKEDRPQTLNAFSVDRYAAA